MIFKRKLEGRAGRREQGIRQGRDWDSIKASTFKGGREKEPRRSHRELQNTIFIASHDIIKIVCNLFRTLFICPMSSMKRIFSSHKWLEYRKCIIGGTTRWHCALGLKSRRAGKSGNCLAQEWPKFFKSTVVIFEHDKSICVCLFTCKLCTGGCANILCQFKAYT